MLFDRKIFRINYKKRIMYVMDVWKIWLRQWVETYQALNGWVSSGLSIEALIGCAALLAAVLIPLAIFLIDNNETGFKWDKAVILKNVLNPFKLVISFVLLSLPLIFWTETNYLNVVVLFLYVAGLCLLAIQIHEAYKWLVVTEAGSRETYRTTKRISYLSKLNDNDSEAIWSLTWGDNEARSLIDDRKLVKAFFRKMESITDTEIIGSAMIRDFQNNLTANQIRDPLIYESISQFSFTHSKLGVEADEKGYQFVHANQQVLEQLIAGAITDEYMGYMFFDQVKKYLDNTTVNSVDVVKYLSVNIFGELDRVEAREISIWENFPEEWKVSTGNLKNNKTGISQVWLHSYLEWIVRKNLFIFSEEFQYDDRVDNATRELIPDVDPMTWSELILLEYAAFSSRKDEDLYAAKVRNFIESKHAIGLMGRTYGFWEDDSPDSMSSMERFKIQQQKEIRATFEMMKLSKYFRVLSNKDLLGKFITATMDYELNGDKNKEDVKDGLLNLLNQLFDYLSGIEESSKK